MNKRVGTYSVYSWDLLVGAWASILTDYCMVGNFRCMYSMFFEGVVNSTGCYRETRLVFGLSDQQFKIWAIEDADVEWEVGGVTSRATIGQNKVLLLADVW